MMRMMRRGPPAGSETGEAQAQETLASETTPARIGTNTDWIRGMNRL